MKRHSGVRRRPLRIGGKFALSHAHFIAVLLRRSAVGAPVQGPERQLRVTQAIQKHRPIGRNAGPRRHNLRHKLLEQRNFSQAAAGNAPVTPLHRQHKVCSVQITMRKLRDRYARLRVAHIGRISRALLVDNALPLKDTLIAVAHTSPFSRSESCVAGKVLP